MLILIMSIKNPNVLINYVLYVNKPQKVCVEIDTTSGIAEAESFPLV